MDGNSTWYEEEGNAQVGGDVENGVDWGMVGNGAITAAGGGLMFSGGIALSSTGAGALIGVSGIMLGSAAMGFGTAMMVAGFSGKNVNIPGGLGEALDKGFGGSGTIGQIIDIGSGGLPKNLLDAGLMGHGLYNSNLGQMMLFNPLNINNGSSNPFVAPRDNTNVVLPFRRP